jgi:hypothetical protein
MPFRNNVLIVTSPRPRVGKTLLARLLIDFHLHESRPVEAFDLNPGRGMLVKFMPERASLSEIDSVQGQMALFDRLVSGDGTGKIVDISHESFESFFALANHVGFFEEAAQRGVAVAVLFIMAPDQVSIDTYADLRVRLAEVMLLPVHNEMLGPAQYRSKYQARGGGLALLRLPLLAPGWRKYIDQPPLSFSDANFLDSPTIPSEVQIELQHWLRKIYLDFREIDMRLLLTDLRASIRL